ncbi:hypothetical protein R3P38DRAFT_2781185 [Favolaschia claudopus]|uniref:Uncharacterized protein n=1 Tax=Favolaschia claudopus TaxID=2862362 RepID=A0AAW0B655_9AGAR
MVLSREEGYDSEEDDIVQPVEEVVFSEHDSDIAFINDSTDLSVYDTSEDENPMPDNAVNDESELSDLPLEVAVRSPTKKKGSKTSNSGSDDVTIVPTPSPSKRKSSRRRTRAVVDMDTDEDMFSKGSAVKASALPPALSTRKISRETSATLSATSSRNASATRTTSGGDMVAAGAIHGDNSVTSDRVASPLVPASPTLPPVASAVAPPVEQVSDNTAVFKEEMQSYLRDLMKTQMEGFLGSVLPAIRQEFAAQQEASPSASHQNSMSSSSPPLVPVTPKKSVAIERSTYVDKPSSVVTPMQARSTALRDPPVTPSIPQPSVPASSVVTPMQARSTALRDPPVTPSIPQPSVPAASQSVSGVLLPGFQTPAAPVDNPLHMANEPLPPVFLATHDAAKRLDFANIQETPSISVQQAPGANRLVTNMILLLGGVAISGNDMPGATASVDDQTRYNIERLFASSGKRKQEERTDVSVDGVSTQSASTDTDANPPSSKKTKVLDDFTWHHVNYTPPTQCEVYDDELQDPAIKHLFDHLGDKSLVPSYTPPSEANDTRRGGRVSFSRWASNLKQFEIVTLINAISFTESGRFINGSRISPASVTMRPVNSRPDNPINSYRVCVGNVGAVCVSVGMCTQSCVMRTSLVAGNRYRKSIGIVVHNQDWERLEAWTCVCFNEDVLYCQISGKALLLTTRMSSNEETKEAAASSRGANQSMFKWVESPKKNSSPKKPVQTTALSNVAMTLGPNDTSESYTLMLPVYDARDREFDFTSGLADLEHNLPLWQGGEVPVGAFIVAGYSMHSYMGKAQGVDAKVLHVSNNLLWVIVCGVPL